MLKFIISVAKQGSTEDSLEKILKVIPESVYNAFDLPTISTHTINSYKYIKHNLMHINLPLPEYTLIRSTQIIKESIRDNKGMMFKNDAWYQIYNGDCVNMTKNNNGFSKWKKGTRLDCELDLN